MCGIAGILLFQTAPSALDRDELVRMRDQMHARGPDASGAWFSPDGRVGLGHRRLSIIDLSDRALQPMQSADGTLQIVFNGEIYNYRALRAELAAAGRQFVTHSDTEVLLHLYAEQGELMFSRLRGMYAFALWDAPRRRLLLGRDPYGIKPLYFARGAHGVRFASQVKALLAGGALSRAVDPRAQVAFYMLGSVPEPLTYCTAIEALPAGQFIAFDADGSERRGVHHAFSAELAAAMHDPHRHSQAELEAAVACAVRDSVEHHMVADVPIGAFLSAGIDSGTLTALMCEQSRDVLGSVTLSFEEFADSDNDEVPLAETVARRYGTRQSTRVVNRSELDGDLPRLLAAMDQPSIDGINTFFVSKAARELGWKVAISGLGGDELFGGYPSFRDVPRWVALLRQPSRVPGLGVLLRHALRPFCALSLSRMTPKAASLLEYGGGYAGAYFLRRGLFMPWELDALLPHDVIEAGLAHFDPIAHIAERLLPDPGEPFERVAALESQLYMRNQLLRDTDWASMAHSIEVRTPLVDVRLLSALAPLLPELLARGGKRLLASAPQIPLPPAVLARPKTGFTTPIASWLQASPALDAWRSVPLLARNGVHWSRRLAHAVASTWPGST